MISAYLSTSGFGLFYYYAGAENLAMICTVGFVLFILYSLLSYLTSLVILFRLSITTSLILFALQVFYTGGTLSPSMAEFIIPPLLAFFYRPIRDRYYFMVISGITILTMWPLTTHGYTKNVLENLYAIEHSILVILFVFSIVTIYSILFRATLAKKNKQLSESMDELKEATQKMIHSEKMASLGVLSAGVAHEINNPLNFIKGGVEMLSKKLKNKKEYEPFIQAIEEGVTRASSIVNSMGHFSRQGTSMDEECDLHEVIENCLTMLQNQLKYKIEVVKDFSLSPHLKIVGNEGKLHQAILNIVANAQQSIQDRGKIMIETRAKKDYIRLKISDTGSGISKENLDKISDPFFTTKPAGVGTGLGLAITYRIIEEHKGKILVNSEINKGTEFIIHFELDERFK